MTIDGGDQNVVIDGGANKLYRPFAATTAVNLTLKDLTLNRCGKTQTVAIGYGGSISWFRAGALTLERVNITNGLAKTASASSSSYIAYGGGLHVEGNSTSGTSLTLTDVSISGCVVEVARGSSNGGIAYGGGLSIKGTVPALITRSKFLNNAIVTNASGTTVSYGGGVSLNAPTDPAQFIDCTISGNTGAQYGGGISYYLGSGADANSAMLSLNRCTVSDNNATPPLGSGGNKAAGGGIYVTGASSLFGALELYASTIANNTTTHPSGTAQGGGLYATTAGSTFTYIYNATIAGNSASSGTVASGIGGGIYLNSVASNYLIMASSIVQANTMSATGSASNGADITKGTNAVISGTLSNILIGSTNGAHGIVHGVNACIIGAASLNPLADNGGLTQTMSLPSTSLAVDAGSVGVASTYSFDVTVDQRGTGYARGAAPDIGAFEYQPPPPEPNSYEAWLIANSLPPDGSGIAAPTASASGDGVVNAVKFALGLRVSDPGYGDRIGYALLHETQGDYLSITYTRPDPAPAGVTYLVKISSDLVTWSALPTVEVSNSVTNGLRSITVRDTQPLDAAAPLRFIYLEITLQ